jgi:hypothetical protein
MKGGAPFRFDLRGDGHLRHPFKPHALNLEETQGD